MLDEPVFGALLEIVPAESIRPHEIADPARQQRIERLLRDDGMLRDPLLVGRTREMDGYLLLDGTNRRIALNDLEVPWCMVHIVDYADRNAVDLKTWCHAIRLDLASLVEAARSISCLETVAVPVLESGDALRSPGILAIALDGRDIVAFRMSTDHGNIRTDVLRAFVDLYEHVMTRVECDPEELEIRAHALQSTGNVLIAFPPFSRTQVLTMATRELLIPSGITRHIVLSGRALRVNLPLAILREQTIDAARDRFHSHLSSLRPRTYREATILFDS